MATDDQIRTALTRVRKAIELRPSVALGTMKSTTRLEDGMRCISTCGDWKIELDEPESVGGDGSAPSPGVYALAAISGCLAMCIKNFAVIDGLEIDAVNVDIEADYDEHNAYGLKPVPPAGYTGFRIDIELESDAPEDQLQEIVGKAMEFDSWYRVFTNAQQIEARISVNHTAV